MAAHPPEYHLTVGRGIHDGMKAALDDIEALPALGRVREDERDRVDRALGVDEELHSRELRLRASGLIDCDELSMETRRTFRRVKADLTDPHYLLGQVELDLETKTVAEFLEEWRPA